MNLIFQNYIETFNKVSKTLLEDYGFTTDVNCQSQSVIIKIKHDLLGNYSLSFSTHHLDYKEGVIISEMGNSNNVILPNEYEIANEEIYAYQGVNLENEIVRILKDFKYIIFQQRNLSGRPFVYCSSNSVNKELTCKNSFLKEVSSNELDKVLRKEEKVKETHINIVQCDNCKGFWKIVKDEYDRFSFLKIGENSDSKYLERNNEDYKKLKFKSFPLTQFSLSEAMIAGLKIPCGLYENIDNYYGLSCSPNHLKHKTSKSFKEAIGNTIKIDIYECSKCNQLYEIKEEYDTHRGTSYECKRM